MPQSLANVLLHIVFSTKNRAPFLQDPAIREEMNGYMVGTLKAIECPSLIVRTVEDHLHCLCQLSRTMSIAKLVEAHASRNRIRRALGLGLRNLAPLGLPCSAAEQKPDTIWPEGRIAV